MTVDDELPGGGSAFASITHIDPSSASTPPQTTELWVALIEKAYAQENGEGWLPSNTPGLNSYQAINYIFSSDGPNFGTAGVLSAITGSPTSALGVSPGTLGSDWLNGDPVVVGTPDSPQESIGSINIVEGHVYAVVGYTAATGQFKLFSPWGLGAHYTPSGSTTSVFCAGLVTATSAQLSADFFFGTVAGAAASSSASLNHGGMAALPDADTQAPIDLDGHARRREVSARTVVRPVAGLFKRSLPFKGTSRFDPSPSRVGA